MSNSTPNNDVKSQPNKNGFGGKLRSARTSRGYSLDVAAGEVNILKRYLQALEEENFDALPAFAYARGFLVIYAKFLELNSDEIVESFDSAYPDQLKPKTVESPLSPMGELKRERSRMAINPWLVAGFIALIIFGFVLLKIINNATSKKEDQNNLDQQTQILTPNEQAQGAAIGVAGSAIDLDTTQNTQESSDTGVIDIWSKGDVNIKITDKNGNILMQGMQSRGGYQIKGEPPISVEIDNPAQVDLNFNRKPIRLGEYTKNGHANLTLK